MAKTHLRGSFGNKRADKAFAMVLRLIGWALIALAGWLLGLKVLVGLFALTQGWALIQSKWIDDGKDSKPYMKIESERV